MGNIRDAYFSDVYPSGVVVGDGFTMAFTTSSAVNAYLPAGGKPGALTSSLVDPTSSSSGVFGGQVLALRLNLDFNDAGGILSSDLEDFGSVVLPNTDTFFDGSSISEILDAAESALGGGWIDTVLNILVTNLNEAFDNCVPNDWAQTHLAPSQD